MTTSFFDDDDFVTTSTDHLCVECRRDVKSLYKKLPATGNGSLKTLIIADTPLLLPESESGKHIGDGEGWFKDQLRKHKLNLIEDFWIIGTTLCRSRSEYTKQEMSLCFSNITKFIKENKPKFVILLGEHAIKSWFMTRFSNLTQERWRGLCIPDFERGVWVIPIYHPYYVIANEKNNLIQSQYIRDLEFAINCIKTKPNLKNVTKPDFNDVVIMKDYDQVISELSYVLEKPPKFICFDYETTGLKPYRQGHKIASISYCYDYHKAFSFPYQYPHWKPIQQKQIKLKWCEILQNPSLKIAHNIKFEDVWSRIILQTNPAHWYWCSMIAAHSLDNRSKYTGLKFQSFINWGLPNYDKEIKPFLESVDDRGFNRVMQAPLNKLLLYGGIDSLATFWLYNYQKGAMNPHIEKGFDLFVEGTLALADVQIHGINVDTAYYRDTHIELDNRIEKTEKELLNYEECKKFEKAYGRLPNLGSSKDLELMFFKVLKLEPIKLTDSGKNNAVDADVMSKLNTPLAKAITDLARIKKVNGTYLLQFIKEIDDDGRIHPFYDLSTVKTYRGSSNGPNFQNIPVRNEEAKKISRSGIIPSPGHKILDFDYGAIEVRMGACYTKDPVLISYIMDSSTDMHRDTAMDIFSLRKAPLSFWKEKKTGNKLRFFTKNGFVFPEWYGSYYKNCAKNIWRECSEILTHEGITIKEHFKRISKLNGDAAVYEYFVNHVKKVEEAYWKKFKVFKQWQDNQYKYYEETGLVKLLSGFECKGYLGRNEIVNYAFQGTAFHGLLWSLTQINAEFQERQMLSKVIGQIHDCCVIDTHPKEEKLVRQISTDIATKRIREYFKWIIVPLIIEWEETKIDECWYSKIETREE
jgi:uracil-DNA glycosylase family 4